MRILITGATGFIGTELVKELLAAGHQVRGLTRSEDGAEQLKFAGAEVHRGNLQDLESLRSGAAGMDAVVNLAFNHDDMSKFAESGQDERDAIEALGSVLEPGKLLVVTSGTGITAGGPGHVRVESDVPQNSEAVPRQPENVARAVAERGVRVAIVRLPQVHDTRKQGLVPFLTQTAREKGVSAYVGGSGDGANRWAAAPLADVAHLYRLVLEQTGPGVTVYHAVQEEGVPPARDRRDDWKRATGADGFTQRERGRRALWMAGALCRAGHARVERVDAPETGLEPHRPRFDRRPDEHELLVAEAWLSGSRKRVRLRMTLGAIPPKVYSASPQPAFFVYPRA